jgi:hypothetical protein
VAGEYAPVEMKLSDFPDKQLPLIVFELRKLGKNVPDGAFF